MITVFQKRKRKSWRIENKTSINYLPFPQATSAGAIREGTVVIAAVAERVLRPKKELPRSTAGEEEGGFDGDGVEFIAVP
jgi:hypothetical protein